MVEKSLDKLAKEINAEHRKVEAAMGDALGHARQAGKRLVEAKERTHHGEWLPWLEANFEGSERRAQMYMRVHSRWPEIEANTKSVSDLTLTGALRAIAPPQEGAMTRERTEGPLRSRERTEGPLRSRKRIEGPLRWPGKENVPDNGTAEPCELGVIEQLEASAEGREALAKANRDLVEGQARDRVLRRISDLYFLGRKVPPEDVARDVMARHVGEAAENAVLGRASSGSNYNYKNAREVHAWLGEFLRLLEEANAQLRELSNEEDN